MPRFFTELPRREILRTSPKRSSRKFTHRRLCSDNDARTISTVGEPFKPSGVAYILQPSAYLARSGTENRSSPSTLRVGLPGKLLGFGARRLA
jgi:hypothetical protein